MDFLILFWKCLCTKFFFLMTIIHRVIFLHPHIAWCFCMRMQNVVLFCLIGQLLHNPNIHLISLFFRRQSIGRPTLYVYFKLFCPKFCHHRRQRISTRSSPTRQTYTMFAKPAMPKMPMRRQKIAMPRGLSSLTLSLCKSIYSNLPKDVLFLLFKLNSVIEHSFHSKSSPMPSPSLLALREIPRRITASATCLG